ncbi:LssY C-terminal domain-containing protein [Microbacterium sp.]|uniref:LssY C-terminal domain-containing protein n=1 Tax=Microbacterium sp. TaxID=51671 RepID=UPI00333FF3A4
MTSRSPEEPGRRRWAPRMQQSLPTATVIDRIAFLVGTISAIWLAVVIGMQGFRYPWSFLVLIPVWVITAYLALPRLHRLLSDLYVPDYFFGRTRTGDGLLGDPVNLGVDGSPAQLDEAMIAAGWHRADEITAASTWRIITSTITRRSYPTAPVSPLMLFGRRHDVAYQQEVEGNPKQRHHVRFWHTPPGWLLPGGARTDWMGAGTYDTDVGLSFFTLQVTHRIDENTDIERDYVVSSVREAVPTATVRTLHDFTTGYHSRNGGGDRFVTDGDLPILDLTGVAVDEAEYEREQEAEAGPDRPTAHDIIDRMPLTVVAAVVLVVVSAIFESLSLLFDKEVAALLAAGGEEGRIAYIVVLAFVLVLAVLQLVIALLVLRRGRGARLLLMILLVLDILTTAISYLDGTAALRFNGTLFSASLQCLALLALSSESAGAWSRGRRRGELMEEARR